LGENADDISGGAGQRAYHHGDLRRAILDAALRALQSVEPGALSFRELARAAQVSSGAPYHHFRDRSELLAVLAGEGFGMLLQRLEQAQHLAPSPAERLSALAAAYIAFGRQNPSYYRVMFLPDATQDGNIHHVKDRADACFEVLAACLRDGLPGWQSEVIAGRATSVWAYVHGLVSLGGDGPLRRKLQPEAEDAMARSTAAAIAWSNLAQGLD
jgi:AcrR family transcriptional regulator